MVEQRLPRQALFQRNHSSLWMVQWQGAATLADRPSTAGWLWMVQRRCRLVAGGAVNTTGDDLLALFTLSLPLPLSSLTSTLASVLA
jgi:hypothetical protein